MLLLIDEYDHFANSILADNLQLFQQMVGKGGFVRSFYETLKAAAAVVSSAACSLQGVAISNIFPSPDQWFQYWEKICPSRKPSTSVGFTVPKWKHWYNP
ncbi:MAG: AAA family ATPase [Thiolinea sp.]